VPRLVDTTIRLLSQEPLAGRLPTAEVLRVAETLDQAGFACLEISGGGVFDATVRRRVESPWERIRGIKARVSTPLGIALRGRFLVGSRPVSGDIVPCEWKVPFEMLGEEPPAELPAPAATAPKQIAKPPMAERLRPPDDPGLPEDFGEPEAPTRRGLAAEG